MNSKVTKFAAGGSEFCGRALADGLDTAGAAKTTEDAAATVCSKFTINIWQCDDGPAPLAQMEIIPFFGTTWEGYMDDL